MDWSRVTFELVVAVRRLSRAPAFAISAIVLIGTGLGVGTSFFNLINAAILKPQVNGESLVRFSYQSSVQWSILDDREIELLVRDPPDSLAWIAGFNSVRTAVVIGGAPRTAKVDSVFGPYLEASRISALIGRLLDARDESPDREPVAVVSEQFWRVAFAGDASVLGATIVVAGQPLTIVGVGRAAFTGLSAGVAATDVWVPSRIVRVRQLLGQLRPGVTIAQANAELGVRYPELASRGSDRRLQLRSGLSPPLPPAAYLVVVAALAVGALVAGIAGASFTLVLMARTSAGQAELAIRRALGASTRDITRLLAIEVGLVAAAGALVGLALASALARLAAQRFMAVSEMGTLALDPSPDWRVFAYMLAGALVLGFFVTRVLAEQTARVTALTVVSSAAGAGGATALSLPRRARLVASQVAGVTVLLLLALLFVRSTIAGLVFDPGFDPTGVAIGWIDQTAAAGDVERARLANRQLLETVRQSPAISHAALVSRLPGDTPGRSVKARTEQGGLHWTQVQSISSGFFAVVGLRVIQGRSFSAAEESTAAPVVVISQSVAETFWSNREALGRRLWFATPTGVSEPVQVVGVVANANVSSDDPRDRRDVFLPMGYRPESSVALVARGAGPATTTLDTLRAATRGGGPHAGLLSSRTLEEELAGTVAAGRLVAAALGMLGAIGLFIAVAGVYGVTAQLASQRRREIGIRQALGATNAALCGMLVRENVGTLLLGIVPGLLLGQIAALTLRSAFRNLQPFDPWALATVTAVLLVSGLVSAVLPFWHVVRDTYAPLREW